MPPATTAPDSANIARHLPLMAALQPKHPALKIPRGRTRSGDIDYLALSFAELDAEVAAWAARLTAAGVRTDDRVLVMVRQGLPLIAAAFALFKIGAVPVVIDPGMGLKSFLACVARSRPRALLGIRLAQILSHLFRPSFRTVEIRIPASSNPLARLPSVSVSQLSTISSQLPSPSASVTPTLQLPTSNFQLVKRTADDLAAVLFTSGSTGVPKGVRYNHGMFEAQVRLIRETYAIQPGEIDLPMLPIFALFNPALGMTTIVPEIDPARPAAVDPAKIVQAIRQENVTNSFGSPTLWKKISLHCISHNLTLPSLRRVLCAGAPVPASLWDESRVFLRGGENSGRLHSPYGATEALPVATISSDEVDTSSVRGACVGKAVDGVEIKIIAITDAPIATLADARELPCGEVGEIIVRGPNVTHAYDALPEATAASKISDPNAQRSTFNAQRSTPGISAPVNPPSASDHLSVKRSALSVERSPFQNAPGTAPHSSPKPTPTPASVPAPLEVGRSMLDVGRSPDAALRHPAWHRMGDCGYLDADGRLWFCGRKVERVETAAGPLFTEPCEQVFRPHPRIERCALIGLGPRGAQLPALVVQPDVPLSTSERTALARELRELARAHPHTAGITRFYFHKNFPVDVRHNAKIHRLTLARWASAHPASEFKFKSES